MDFEDFLVTTVRKALGDEETSVVVVRDFDTGVYHIFVFSAELADEQKEKLFKEVEGTFYGLDVEVYINIGFSEEFDFMFLDEHSGSSIEFVAKPGDQNICADVVIVCDVESITETMKECIKVNEFQRYD